MTTQDSCSLTDVMLSPAEVQKRLGNFNALLKDIEDLDEKKRLLWLEIYENALTDRQNAYSNYVTLVKICQEKSSEHAVHGKTMATFLERMGRANDQMIKLAELIAKAQAKDDGPSHNDIYDMINKRDNGKKN